MGVHMQHGHVRRPVRLALHGSSRRSPDGEKHCHQEQEEDSKKLHGGRRSQAGAKDRRRPNSKACPYGKVNKFWKECGPSAVSARPLDLAAMGELTFVSPQQLHESQAMITFEVNDMTCGHCASTISKAVAGVDMHAKVRIDIETRRVEVESSGADMKMLKDAIEQAGYSPAEVEVPQSEIAGQSRSSSGCCCG
jgi:copper chaperone